MGENKLSRDYVEMAVINYRYCQYYSETHKQPLDYGTGVEYSSAEVHTVVQIAAQPGITVTEIARVTSRSKSAVSQITTRLEQKGPERSALVYGGKKRRRLCSPVFSFQPWLPYRHLPD